MNTENAELLHQHWEPEPGYPETGTIDGREIRLADVESTLPSAQWPNVVVEHPKLGTVRPWRGLWGF